MKPRLLLADDHQVLLEGVRKLLESEYDIVGTATDGRALITESLRLRPDAIVVDVGLPLLNGIEAARKLRLELPKTKLVVLTQQTRKEYVKEAFRAGATAYVVKQSAALELMEALRAVLAGRYYVSPSIAAEADMPALLDPAMNPNRLFAQNLTARQREVLQLLAEGKSAKKIAAVLEISVKTVEFHKAGIMDELGLRTTAELTRYALEHGIIS